jgi:hypothetical protein
MPYPSKAQTHKEQILRLLREKKWVTAVELVQPGAGSIRYSARIFELRKQGYHILGRSVKGKDYMEYSLLWDKEEKRMPHLKQPELFPEARKHRDR